MLCTSRLAFAVPALVSLALVHCARGSDPLALVGPPMLDAATQADLVRNVARIVGPDRAHLVADVLGTNIAKPGRVPGSFYGPHLVQALTVFATESDGPALHQALTPLAATLDCAPAVAPPDAARLAATCPRSGPRLLMPDEVLGADPDRTLLALALEQDAQARGLAATELHRQARAAILDAPTVLDRDHLLRGGRPAAWDAAIKDLAATLDRPVHVAAGTTVAEVLRFLAALTAAHAPAPDGTPQRAVMRLVGHGLDVRGATALLQTPPVPNPRYRAEISQDATGAWTLEGQPVTPDRLADVLTRIVELNRVPEPGRIDVVLALGPERDFADAVRLLIALTPFRFEAPLVLAVPRDRMPPAPAQDLDE